MEIKINVPTGFLLINKPTGITSHDVIDALRRVTGVRTIGHAGTLDPFATGLLIVAVGREATREIARFVKMDKKYLATLTLGAESDTYDRTGIIVKNSGAKLLTDKGQAQNAHTENTHPSAQAIQKVLETFTGDLTQLPPMFSAKKIAGKKLYQLARQGITVERAPQRIHIFAITLLSYHFPVLKIAVRCSSGTYIRSLARDIGVKLGCGAYLEELSRAQIGLYQLADALELDSITTNNWTDFVRPLSSFDLNPDA